MEDQRALQFLSPVFRGEAVAWDAPDQRDQRFVYAQKSLVQYVIWRSFTLLSQEAYKLSNNESRRRWLNVFSFFYPVKGELIRSGSIDKVQLRNMWWANFPTVSILNGLKDDADQPGGTFARLNIEPTLSQIKTALESFPDSPFRVFMFNAGRDAGNVIQVRWDGCVGAAYMHHCRIRGINPDVRPNEHVLGRDDQDGSRQ